MTQVNSNIVKQISTFFRTFGKLYYCEMNLFYVENININSIVVLEPDESKHAVRVLRISKGDKVKITDGKGNLFEADVVNDNYKIGCELQIIRQLKNTIDNYYSHIAVSPTKNLDRIEWMVEKATEMGVHEITPIICERTEKVNIKTERLEKICLSAMKQSGRAWLPKINEPVKLIDFINSYNLPQSMKGEKIIAHCDHLYADEFIQNINSVINKNSASLVLIGPEGDFTKQEVEAALQKNFIPVSLGVNRLRTETAALYACAVIYNLNS